MRTKGTISKRLINGKEYFYYQYLEDGKLISKTVNKLEAYDTAFSLYFQGKDVDEFRSHKFNFQVEYGASLISITKIYDSYKRRYCYKDITEYLTDDKITGKVLILYGLRRTGKTALENSFIDKSLRD